MPRRATPWPALAALACLCAPATPAGAGTAGASLLETGATAIRFAVDVPDPVFTPLGEGTAGVRLRLEGYQGTAGPDDPGLPVRVLLIAVPPTGAVRVSGTGGGAEVHEGVVLDGMELRPGGARGPWPAAWGSPGPRVRLLDVSWMRNQRVARIEVRPADYDPATRRLTVHRRIEATVQVEAAAGAGAPGTAAAEALDPFEGVYRRTLLNYEQGRAWRRTAPARAVAPAALRSGVLPDFVAAVPETSVYFGREWIKIPITRTGFYRVTYGLLRSRTLFAGDTADSTSWAGLDDLRLFTWPGVPVLPEDSYCDSCDYREVALLFEDDGDDRFGNIYDAFVFYAMGPSDWASLYDATKPESVFVNHPYATENYYYLARSTLERPVAGEPARMDSLAGAIVDPGLEPPGSFPARVHLEQDIEYYPNSTPLYGRNDRGLAWEKWFWRAVRKGGTIQEVVDLPGADTTQAVRLRALTWGLDYNLGSASSLQDHYVDLSFNSIGFPRRGFDDLLAQVFDSTFTDLRTAGNVFRMSVPDTTDPLNSGRSDVSGLAWFDLFYARRFAPVGGRLDFDTPAGGNGDVVYRIGPFDTTLVVPPHVFEVSDACRPRRVVGAGYTREGDARYLGFQAAESGRRRYRVVPADSIVTLTQGPSDAPAVSLEQNLRSRTQQADYIIIYYDGDATGAGTFRPAADSLAAWRQVSLPLSGVEGPYATRTIPISALYDQFSGGRKDPVAIRNFLRAAYYNWNDGGATRRPSFVTLLGDASYDFKNLKGLAPTGQPGCLLPTFENNFDPAFQVRDQYTTDDRLLNVDDAAASRVVPDFYGGRIPVGDAAAALAVVRGKVLAHERSGVLGEWRDRVMFIADDDQQGSRADALGWDHLEYTVALDRDHTPAHLDREYVYLHTYPTTAGFTKSGAKEDIKQGLQDGAVLVNFVGHGSPNQLADEKIMLESDVGALANAPRFPVFITASCAVGKFSDPNKEGLGEKLVASTAGGAVSVISATGLAYSWQNAELNRTLFDRFFGTDTVDCQYHVPVAEALYEAKTGDINEMKYQLMGDAATRLALPRLWVELTLTDSAGAPVTEVRRGQRLHFAGRVLDCPGGEAVPLQGAVAMLIEDSAPYDTARSTTAGTCPYLYDAGPIFRGDAGVTDGAFRGSFVVPLEAREGPRGRLRAYVQGTLPGSGAETDGVGHLRSSVAAGEVPSGDLTGPRIGLSFVGGSTTVRPDAVLSVDLFDESGILTTNHTPQNGIIVTIDGNTTTRADITGTFRYAADSYQSGRATYTLPNLAEGAHTVSVSAADNLAAGLSAGAHRSRASLDFTVVAQPSLRISHAYLFPNPTRSGGGGGGGQFVVDAPGDSVNVLLRIYTASGRLVRTLTQFGGLGQVQLPWDGLDEEGQALANGVYFFRAHVNLRAGDGSSSPAQKADADGRFVIVNRE